MANTYFQFKQFRIDQEHCAMKVTNDACVFGGWAADLLSKRTISGNSLKILDIGTGTGLLTLMMAQKELTAQIDAVEIEGEAAKQATINFDNSIWKDRFQVFTTDIRSYEVKNKQYYDFIISNPPFFDNDLKSESSKRNLAMHSEALGLNELLASIKRLLCTDGTFAILLPYHRSASFEVMAETNGFYLVEKVLVKQTPKHSPFRTMLLFGNRKDALKESEITIKDGDIYTDGFCGLLKEYYLHL